MCVYVCVCVFVSVSLWVSLSPPLSLSFSVSLIRRILTWTTGSSPCLSDLFACVYTRGSSVYRLIQRTLVGHGVGREFGLGGKIAHIRRAKPGTKRSAIHVVTTLDHAQPQLSRASTLAVCYGLPALTPSEASNRSVMMARSAHHFDYCPVPSHCGRRRRYQAVCLKRCA